MNKKRCFWVQDSEQICVDYHDNEWGVPVHDDQKLFEFLVLDAFQAGLSWLIILRKRENIRNAFDNFNSKKIAQYDDEKIYELLSDSGMVLIKYL